MENEIDLAKLRQLAVDVLPGPWYVSGSLAPEECGQVGGVGPTVVADDPDEDPDDIFRQPVEVCDCGPYGWGPGLSHAEYIASLPPEVVIAMVDALAEARTVMQDFVDKYEDGQSWSQRTYDACQEWLKKAPR